MSKNFKRTKILATIGPAVDSAEKITDLIMSGVNGCRFNSSHGTDEERIRQLQWVREASRKKQRAIATVLDLPGPKIRLGTLKDNHLEVKTGDRLILDADIKEHDGSQTLPVQYNFADKCQVGEPILLRDGLVKTHVDQIISDTAVEVTVENDGTLSSKNGINLPNTDFHGDILTDKDLAEIEFAAQHDYDYVAMSFIQSARDVEEVREALLAHGSDAQVIAKIETKAAVADLDHMVEIVEASDGIMVARGDLAIEAGAEIVPIVQRQLIALCREHAKLCIVATQMMGSMTTHLEPTRAEVSDVASAVIQGADALMLSEETATGQYPIEAVKAMRKVILYTQNHSRTAPLPNIPDIQSSMRKYNALAHTAAQLAKMVHADVIVCQSASGATSATVAARRSDVPIITVTSNPRVAGQLALTYSTSAFVRPHAQGAGIKLARELKESGFLRRRDGKEGDIVAVVVSGDREVVGMTDTIKLRYI